MAPPSPAERLKHVRPVQPLRFPAEEPESEHLGQSKRHLALCATLAQLLRDLFAPEHSYGADQFVYWNARTPRRCLAPDGFVKLGVPDEIFDTWKTWEKGVPELAVEILSPSDTPERYTFAQKLERYHEMGIKELVCFNVDEKAGRRLRVWDRLEDDLVERVVEGERTPCVTLQRGLEWTVAPTAPFPATLRLLRDGALVPSVEEERDAANAQAAAANAQAAAANAQAAAANARAEAAERRAEELERLAKR